MTGPEEMEPTPDPATHAEIKALLPKIVARAPRAAVEMLQPYPDEFVAKMLLLLNPALAQSALERFPSERRQRIIAAAAPATRQQWMRNEDYPGNVIGHMMEPALAVFRPTTTVGPATEELRHFAARAFITYAFVVDENERLLGVVAMREIDPATASSIVLTTITDVCSLAVFLGLAAWLSERDCEFATQRPPLSLGATFKRYSRLAPAAG